MQLDKKLICLAAVIIELSFCAGCNNVNQLADRQLDAVIEWELNEGDRKPDGNSVLVALYLDTKDSKDTTMIAEAEYRCYDYEGGGYSGIRRVPFRTPWTKWEKIRSNRFKKKIVIDPGPPYKKAERIVTLISGEVANLGRIVLEKVEPKGIASILEIIGIKETVSISGIIKDENGKPLESVTVSSNKTVVTTDPEGSYRIDGLGLEVYDLNAKKEGYIPGSAKVSIRNMDERIISRDFVLSRQKKIRFRYVISPLVNDDFNSPEAVEGTLEFIVDKNFMPLVVEQFKDKDFGRFADKVRLKFRVNNGKLTLHNSYAPIFYKRYRSSSEEFETISSVGTLNINSQRCPPIQEGDIILINGGRVSDYTLKILFEEVQQILP